MDYFFRSEGCPSCETIVSLLNQQNWTGCLQIVDVEFDIDKQLITRINDKIIQGSPVSRVPAYYSSEEDKLFIGADETLEGIQNANWYN